MNAHISMRPYQQAGREKIHAEWDAGRRSTLLVLPTGTGKTIVMAAVAEDQVLAQQRVLILAHRGELLEQASDKILNATGLRCAVEKAEQTCLDSLYRITVGSVQSLMRPKRLEQFPHDYQDSLGARSIELYQQGGRAAMEWQELLIYDITARDPDGLWTHSKFGVSLPRRNGKTELFIMREKIGLVDLGEHILHTAHRTSTSHSAWERMCRELDHSHIPYSSIRAKGSESITLENGARIEYRTRSSKGGLGEGFDLLVIDEAQEYGDDEESALKYVVSDSRNPQTILCGTPPTMTSSGTVFGKLRAAVLEGRSQHTGWAEWGVEFQTDPHDVDAWYETNPSMGVILNERKVSDEITTDDLDFNIQRLGLWLTYNVKSAITPAQWDALKCDKLPSLRGKLYAGVKFGKDGQTAALSIAVKTGDDRIFVECIDCRPMRAGRRWIVDFLAAADVAKVAVDGAGYQKLLQDDIKDRRLHKPVVVLPKVEQVITANAAFSDALDAKTICHMGQPSVVQIVTNCQRRAIGQNGGFGYKSIKDGVAIEILDSLILAHWQAQLSRRAKKQTITY